MGADLLITAMAAPHRDGQDSWDIDMVEAERIGHERIDAHDLAAWSDDDLDNLALNLGVRTWDPYPQSEPESEPERLDTPHQQLITDLRAALHQALTELLGYRRDVTSMDFGGRCYWLTGGMSWGDTPTDSYEWIAALNWIGLFDDALP